MACFSESPPASIFDSASKCWVLAGFPGSLTEASTKPSAGALRSNGVAFVDEAAPMGFELESDSAHIHVSIVQSCQEDAGIEYWLHSQVQDKLLIIGRYIGHLLHALQTNLPPD